MEVNHLKNLRELIAQWSDQIQQNLKRRWEDHHNMEEAVKGIIKV